MTQQETTTVPTTLLPAKPTLSSYSQAIQGDPGLYYRNSIIASSVSTVITIILAVLAAYAFARPRFRFNWHLISRNNSLYRAACDIYPAARTTYLVN